jgi:hypothetical protein
VTKLSRYGNSENALIDYSLADKKYIISQGDFEKVEEYCENECMGIKFLTNANFLRELVKVLNELGVEPPFSIDDFKSKEFIKLSKEKGLTEKMEKQFGTKDIELVAKIVIKSTYNFLHKV